MTNANMRLHIECCGQCGRPLPSARPIVEINPTDGTVSCGGCVLRVTPVQLGVLKALVRAHPNTLSVKQLVAAVYGGRLDGGPLWSDGNIKVMIFDIRQRMRQANFPLSIVCSYGFGYRLEKVST